MNDPNNGSSGPNKGFLVMVAAHVVCCGGILLVVTIGWAGIAALAGIFLDPLVQLGVVISGGVLAVLFWKRRVGNKSRISAGIGSQSGNPDEAHQQ
ncbi:MAG: hypothetical protein O7C61_11510 [SAR324 cluster bacterium]|nr:hypothetical protein [SAR324 cluster bacterium]